MRRQSFYWTFLVLTIVLTAYGGYSIFYNLSRGSDVPLLGEVFFIGGIILLVLLLVLLLVDFLQRKKAKKNKTLKPEEKIEEPQQPEEKEKQPEEEPVPVEKEEPAPEPSPAPAEEVEFVRVKPAPRFRGGSAYIKKVGYGPVLRVEEEEILDMRSNT